MASPLLEFMMSLRPNLFVSHGAPTFAWQLSQP